MKKLKDTPAYPVRLRCAGLIEQNDEIVLVFDPVYLGGCWILPGGGSELEETASQAVEREVLEETGLTVEAQQVCSLREIWEPEKDFSEEQEIRKSFEIVFQCKYISGRIDLKNNPSIKRDGISRVNDCRWVPIQSLTEKIDGFPIYPLEFFNRYRSNQLLRIPLQQIFIPPFDLRV